MMWPSKVQQRVEVCVFDTISSGKAKTLGRVVPVEKSIRLVETFTALAKSPY